MDNPTKKNDKSKKNALWFDRFITSLEKHEGTVGRKKSLENDKIGTRGYGITHIPEAIKKQLKSEGINIDDYPDLELAKRIVSYNQDRLEKVLGKEKWNELPDAMKIVASDQYYNSGQLFDGFKGDLIKGNYENALKNTLDIINAKDPAQKNQKAVMGGLAARRVDVYNNAAAELGYSQISNYNIESTDTNGTNVTYLYNGDENDDNAVTVKTNNPIHTKSRAGRSDNFELVEWKDTEVGKSAQKTLGIETEEELKAQVSSGQTTPAKVGGLSKLEQSFTELKDAKPDNTATKSPNIKPLPESTPSDKARLTKDLESLTQQPVTKDKIPKSNESKARTVNRSRERTVNRSETRTVLNNMGATRQMASGGFKKGLKNVGVFAADNALSIFGANTVMDKHYTNDSKLEKASRITNGIYSFAGTAAATAIGGPAAGMAMGAVQKGVGTATANSSIEEVANTYDAQSQKAMRRMATGGQKSTIMNGLKELGNTKEFKGPSHAQGGIKIGNKTEVEGGEVEWNNFIFTNRF
jgi:hypothetical protein